MNANRNQRRSRTMPALALLLLSACASESGEQSDSQLSGQSGVQSVAGAQAGGVGGTLLTSGSVADPPLQAGTSAIAGTGGAAGAIAGSGSGGNVAAGIGGGAGTSAGMAGTGAAGMLPAVDGVPTIYWLDITTNRVLRSQDFAEGEVIVTRTGTAPDGVAVDVEGGKIYWTNMGSLLGSGGGSLQRANLDGSDVETIVPSGIARTPKQMQVDLVNRHVYFCDREGAKVWRAGMDGSSPEAIVSEHGFQELVGIALDVPKGKFYFTDRIGQKILRANIQMPAGQTGADRTDIEEVIVMSGRAMPIDLDIDHANARIYWTDRQLGTVHRAGLEIPMGQTASNRTDQETIVEGLVETIGISLDVPKNKLYFTELNGGVSEAALDGSGLRKGILSSGSSTGVAIAYVPK